MKIKDWISKLVRICDLHVTTCWLQTILIDTISSIYSTEAHRTLQSVGTTNYLTSFLALLGHIWILLTLKKIADFVFLNLLYSKFLKRTNEYLTFKFHFEVLIVFFTIRKYPKSKINQPMTLTIKRAIKNIKKTSILWLYFKYSFKETWCRWSFFPCVAFIG